MTKSVLGIIGGSGIYDLPGLANVREERIASPTPCGLAGAIRLWLVSRERMGETESKP